MLSCAEVSRLASERADRPLTWRERLAFRFHLAMCRNCARYARQLELLGRAARRLGLRDSPGEDAPGLPPEARERIAGRLRRSSSPSRMR
jgi:hypothetical protein